MAANVAERPGVNQAGPPAPPAPIDQNQDLDNRIYACVVVGMILQGGSIVLGIYFFACLLTVSPVYLFAELIPLILFAVGQELAGPGIGGSQNNAPAWWAPTPFVPGQPIGFPNRNNSCPTNSATQLLLNSNAVNAFLDDHPELPLTRVRQHYRAANDAQRRVADVETQEILPAEIDPHAPEAIDSRDVMRLLLRPFIEVGLIEVAFDPEEEEIPMDAQFNNAIQRDGNHLRNELFLNIGRLRNAYNAHALFPLPIPLAFDIAGRHFEADGFIYHWHAGHYSAFVRKTIGGNHTWWTIDDGRVIQLPNAPREYLQQASVVHYTAPLPA